VREGANAAAYGAAEGRGKAVGEELKNSSIFLRQKAEECTQASAAVAAAEGDVEAARVGGGGGWGLLMGQGALKDKEKSIERRKREAARSAAELQKALSEASGRRRDVGGDLRAAEEALAASSARLEEVGSHELWVNAFRAKRSSDHVGQRLRLRRRGATAPTWTCARNKASSSG
jgi:hypothetical protein